MDKKAWENERLDDIIKKFDAKHPNAKIYWEGWPKITKEDLQDYQRPF